VAIEKEFGSPLIWDSRSEVQMRRVYIKRDINFYDNDNWKEYIVWLKENLDKFYKIFHQRIRQLKTSGPEE
jgi:hypothetical protein